MTYSTEQDPWGHVTYRQHDSAALAALYVATLAATYAEAGHRVAFDGDRYYIPTMHIVLGIVTLAGGPSPCS